MPAKVKTRCRSRTAERDELALHTCQTKSEDEAQKCSLSAVTNLQL